MGIDPLIIPWLYGTVRLYSTYPEQNSITKITGKSVRSIFAVSPFFIWITINNKINTDLSQL